MRPTRPSTPASRFRTAMLPLLLLAIGVPAAFGQTPSPQSAAVLPGFGTTDPIAYHMGYADFGPEGAAYNFETIVLNGHMGRTVLGSEGVFSANVHIPRGAFLVSFEFDACDVSATHHIQARLLNCGPLGAGCTVLGEIVTDTTPGSGCIARQVDLTPMNFTLDNSRQLIVRVITEATDATNIILGAEVGYKLQVSPAPAVATFADVPTTSPQFKFVEALVAAGITAGCGNGNFCPNNPVTRGQMAVFLASALGLHFPN